MTQADWARGDAFALGAFLNGAEIPTLTAEGEPVVDDSFIVLFNAWREPVTFVLPPARFGRRWAHELSTAEPELPPNGTTLPARAAGAARGPRAPRAAPRRLTRARRRTRGPTGLGVRAAVGRWRLPEHAQADLDDARVELRAGRLGEAPERLLDRQRLAVRAVGRHRVERVAGEDDARLERDLLAGEPSG